MTDTLSLLVSLMQDHIKNYDHDITSENDCKEILRQLESDHLMFLFQNFSEKELKAAYLFEQDKSK